MKFHLLLMNSPYNDMLVICSASEYSFHDHNPSWLFFAAPTAVQSFGMQDAIRHIENHILSKQRSNSCKLSQARCTLVKAHSSFMLDFGS